LESRDSIASTQDFVTSDTFITARGWLDAAHYQSLTRVTPLQPGKWYTITVPLDTYDEQVPSGHVLGLILTQSDNEYTTPNPTGATVKVDLAGSRLTLPVAGPGLPRPSSTPTVSTTPSPALTPKVRVDQRQVPLG